jgi:hypothetical protein
MAIQEAPAQRRDPRTRPLPDVVPTSAVPKVDRRRGGSPLLASASVTLALLVALNVLLALPALRRPLDVRSDGLWGYQRLQTCESLGRAPDVLFLGSSRALYSADAHQADDTMRALGHPTLSCNLGRMGASFANDYYTFKRFIEDGYTPKLLVENLWENNLNINAHPPEDIQGTNLSQEMRMADLSDLPDLRAHFGTEGLPALPDFVADKALPLYGERIGLLRALCGSYTAGPCAANTDEWDPQTLKVYRRADDRGWTAMAGYSLANVPAQKLATQYRTLWASILPGTRGFRIGGQQPDYLARMIALARAHGVRIALVVSPVAPIYLKFFDHPSDWQTIMAYWRSFSTAHGVPFFDQSLAPGYTLADFQDPHHLTASGAVKFSTWMARAIVVPVLRAPSH